jgi:hypothetical protein
MCARCRYFHGFGLHCDKVEGVIMPVAWCKLWEKASAKERQRERAGR